MSIADIAVAVRLACCSCRAGLVLLRPAQGPHRRAGRRGAAGGGDGARRVSPRCHPGAPGGAGGAGLRPAGEPVSAPRGWCSATSRSAPALPAYERTTVRLTPAQAGLVRVRLRDEHGPRHAAGRPCHRRRAPTAAAGRGRHRPAPAGGREPAAGRSAADVEAAQAAERRAEIADLTRRVHRRRGPDRAGAVRGDGPRAVRRRLGARAAAQPLAAAGADHAGDVLHRLADPPHRLARPGPPRRGDEQPDHPGHDRRLRLQPAGHRRPGRCCRPTSATCTSRPSGSSSP